MISRICWPVWYLIFACAPVFGAEGKIGGGEIAWGAPVDGLQAGLAFETDKPIWRQGEPIGFLLTVRNVGEKPLPLVYLEPTLKAWAPDLRDPDGKALPVMPPVLPRGGREARPRLAPGESLGVARGTLTVRPLGWEGKIAETVGFAGAGRCTVRYTFTVNPYIFGPSREYQWSGSVTTGELTLEVAPGENAANDVEREVGATKAEIRTVLALLGDYESRGLQGITLPGDTDQWRKDLEAWSARCAALGPGAVGYLARLAVSHPEEGYRAAACDALDDTGQAEAGPALVECLADPSPKVRRLAARSLGHSRFVDEIPHLVKRLQSDVDTYVRESAAIALGNFADGRAIQGLIQALETDDGARVRYFAAQSIGAIADPMALPALKKLLKDPEIQEASGVDVVTIKQLRTVIRNIEDPDFWDMGVKGNLTDNEVYDVLAAEIDLDSQSSTPVSELADFFVARSKGASSRLHEDVTVAFRGRYGIVYYRPDKNLFAVAKHPPGSAQNQYFGPFKGNPHEISRNAREARKK